MKSRRQRQRRSASNRKSRRQRQRRSVSNRKSRCGRMLRGGHRGDYILKNASPEQINLLSQADYVSDNKAIGGLEKFLKNDVNDFNSLQFSVDENNYALQRLDRGTHVPRCGYRRTTRLEFMKGNAMFGNLIDLDC